MTSNLCDEHIALAATGKALYSRLLASVDSLGDTDMPAAPPELAPRYFTKPEVEQPETPFMAPATPLAAMGEAGHPTSSYTPIRVHNLAPFAPPNVDRPQSMYQNYVHVGGKAILCMNNFADRDGLWGRPERLYWSDLMAASCARVVGVEAIWRWASGFLMLRTILLLSLKKEERNEKERERERFVFSFNLFFFKKYCSFFLFFFSFLISKSGINVKSPALTNKQTRAELYRQ
jgi:hypothetical protein